MTGWEPPAIHVASWKPKVGRSAPVAVELCCGMGAIGIGLRSLGIRVAKAYDAWSSAVSIYNHNAPEPVAVCCDLLANDGYKRLVSDGQSHRLAQAAPSEASWRRSLSVRKPDYGQFETSPTVC